MVLQKEKFVSSLDSMPDIDSIDKRLEEILHERQVPDADWPEVKRIFYVLVEIMQAKDSKQLDKIPLGDILKCFTWQYVFEDYFLSEKAGVYLKRAAKEVVKMRTARKRRVL